MISQTDQILTHRRWIGKASLLHKLFPRCPRPHLNLLDLMLELALEVPLRQGVGRREGGGENIRALLPCPKRMEVQPCQVPGGGEEPLGTARCSQVWGSGAGSLLPQILSPSAPVSLGAHGPPCPSLQVHFAPGSPPLQARRPGWTCLWPPLVSAERLRQQEPDRCSRRQ